MNRRVGSAGWGCALVALAGLVGLPSAAVGEVITQEGIGEAPVWKAGQGPENPAPAQQRALRAAIEDAVTRATQELVTAEDPYLDAESAVGALGDDLVSYAARYRLVEDRGIVEPEVSPEAGVEAHYVIVINAQIELDRIRNKLAREGLLVFQVDDRPRSRRLLILEGDLSYTGYREILEALREGGTPTEPNGFRRGEIALDIETAAGEVELARSLQQQLGPRFRLEPAVVDPAAGAEGVFRLRVKELAEPTDPLEAPAASMPMQLP
jgi:hypothetical protein